MARFSSLASRYGGLGCSSAAMKNDYHGITGFFGSLKSQYKVPINTGSQSRSRSS